VDDRHFDYRYITKILFSNKNPNSTATVGGWGCFFNQIFFFFNSSSSSFSLQGDLNVVAGWFFNSSCSPSRDSNPSYIPTNDIYIYIFCNIFQGKHKDSGTDHILLLHLLGGSWQALISVFMCSSK